MADLKKPEYAEDDCPGHVASEKDPRICARCGVHVESLRPPDDEPDDEYSQMTLEQMVSLENWMYDQDVENCSSDYYDQRMKLVTAIEDRRKR